MMLKDSEYTLLTGFVNQNLLNSDKEEVVFELFDGISENILEFPIDKLLYIKDDKQFIYEVYYKLLDRIIDEAAFRHYVQQLKNGNITREKLIEVVFESDERKIKNTNLIYNLKKERKI